VDEGAPYPGRRINVPLSNTSGGTVIGVGVSSSPIGPYTDAIGRPLVTAGCPGGTGDIDPTVFIDDDGQAYLYFGRSVPGYVKLNADMTSFAGGVQCPTVNAQTSWPHSRAADHDESGTVSAVESPRRAGHDV
jgi:arabinoxylan arabinofuranohydrolase